jgi:hypothetical protein
MSTGPSCVPFFDRRSILGRTKPLRGSPLIAQVLLLSTYGRPSVVSLCIPSQPRLCPAH